MARQEFKWTEHNVDKLNKVKDVLKELSKYKPLTLRQVYYQLVGKGYIENNKSQYVMLSKLLNGRELMGIYRGRILKIGHVIIMVPEEAVMLTRLLRMRLMDYLNIIQEIYHNLSLNT